MPPYGPATFAISTNSSVEIQNPGGLVERSGDAEAPSSIAWRIRSRIFSTSAATARTGLGAVRRFEDQPDPT